MQPITTARPRIAHAHAALLLTLIAALAGCQLPNVQPFADAVTAVHAGVDQSGTIFREAAASTLPANDPNLQLLDEHWASRRAATAALAQYADTLASIVDAGNSGSTNAQQLSNAVQGLMTKVGAAGLAGSAAFQIGGEIYETVAQGLAANSLDKAVQNAGPAVAKTCDILIADLQDMLQPIDAVEQDALAKIETKQHTDDVKQLKAITARRKALLDQILASDEDWAANHAAILPQVQALDELIAATAPRISQTNTRKANLARAFQAKRTLIAQTIAALKDLKTSHTDLAQAIKGGRTVNARTLLYSANQLTRTIERIDQIRETSNE